MEISRAEDADEHYSGGDPTVDQEMHEHQQQ